MGIIIHFWSNICIEFLNVIFRTFYYFVGLYLFLPWDFFFCVFVNVLRVSYLIFTNFNVYIASPGSVFVLVHITIDKDADCLQSNSNPSSNDLWLPFLTSFFFLKVRFNKTRHIKLWLFVFLIVYLLLSLSKQIKTPDHNEAIASCNGYLFFTFNYIGTCVNIQSMIGSSRVEELCKKDVLKNF